MDARPVIALTMRLHPKQRGVALYVVSMVLLLSALLMLWSSKTALFLEIVSRNDADYQRAFEAAHAMLEDAKADIALHLQDAAHPHTRTAAGNFLPTNPVQWVAWLAALPNSSTAYCAYGVCYRSMEGENFWENAPALSQMLTTGARYGTYSDHGATSTPHPILGLHTANQGAWYWIEPMPVQAGHIQWAQGANAVPVIDSMLFKVTAIALGLKTAQSSAGTSQRSPTMAVLQSVVVVPLVEDTSHSNGYAPAGPMRTLYWRQMQ